MANANLPPWLNAPPHRWQAGTLDRDALHDAADALRERPGFEAATRVFARAWLECYDGDPVLRSAMRNTARYILMVACIALHHRRDPDDPASGVTAARLQHLFAAPGRDQVDASRSRVKAMLGHARTRGLVERVGGATDGRQRPLAPTDALLGAMSGWVRSFLVGIEGAMPLPAPPAEMVARDGFVGELFCYRLAAFTEDRFNIQERLPAMRFIMSRERGYRMFLRLVEQMERAEDGSASVPVVTSSLAEATELSRAGVRNLLRSCEREGWMHYDWESRRVTLAPDFDQLAMRWLALEFVWMHGLAVAAWARVSERS